MLVSKVLTGLRRRRRSEGSEGRKVRLSGRGRPLLKDRSCGVLGLCSALASLLVCGLPEIG